jgi:putative PIN family toxin of toxin-antitoxin system
MGAVAMTRVVLDTNVLVSGLLFGGVPGDILGLCKSGELRLTMSRAMLDELLRVLAYPKLRLSEEEIHYLLYAEVLPHVDVVRVPPGPAVVAADRTDDMFLHCALAAGAGCIVSGDRHLLRLKSYRRIKILSPSEFLGRCARR